MSNSSVELSSVIEKIHHRAVIAGYVTDAITARAIVSTEVKVLGQNLGAKTKTREDGFFYFLDLPNGQYDLGFLVPPESRSLYGGNDKKNPTTTREGVTVKSEADGRPIFDPKANVKQPPTSLGGTVTEKKDTGTGKAIAKAIVQVRGSEIQTLTDEEGKYSLSDLQAGSPTVQVSANGFATVTQQVTLTAGKETTADFGLEPNMLFLSK